MPGKGKDCALLQSLEASPTTVTLGSVTYYCHAGKRDLLLPRWEAWPTTDLNRDDNRSFNLTARNSSFYGRAKFVESVVER